MSTRYQNNERTDLINVDDIDANSLEDFSESQTDKGRLDDFSENERESPSSIQPAEALDRICSIVIDGIILYSIYWPLALIYRMIALEGIAGPVPATGTHGLIFHLTFLFIAFVLFVITEATICATPGKFICGLKVLNNEGFPPSIFSILIRNFLKPLDLILAPLLIPFASFEWTGLHKRLGDLVAKTVVFKVSQTRTRQYALSLEVISSASTRVIAFLFDLALAGSFATGLALMLSPEYPVASMLIVVFSPVLFLIFFAFPEALFKTSAGKWIFGLVVCHEDGSALSPSGAIMRALWLPIDLTPVGFFGMFVSLRKQRPGDNAAQTVVISAKRELRGLFALVFSAVIAILTLYVGTQNRDNFLHTGFQVNFLPSFDVSGFAPPQEVSSRGLYIQNFGFYEGELKTPRRPSIYEGGEKVFIQFEVGGYGVRGSKVWLQEDILVSYPDGNAALKLENINEFNGKLKQPGPIAFENSVALPENSQTGRYSVTITLRDKLSTKELKEQRFFYISPKEDAAAREAKEKSEATSPTDGSPQAAPASTDEAPNSPPRPETDIPVEDGVGGPLSGSPE